ncbi:RNA polymerase sigma factor [Timonella sp. A28]|uniref:RNA polymerase sigma factor n=1 Tax=Timonella sp. A28 TaxID=3442640 RepID=UPI003EBEBF8E
MSTHTQTAGEDAQEPTIVPLRPRLDDAWFTELFEKYSSHIYKFVFRRTSAEDVEDLTAETFAIAWRRRADIPEGYVLQWLYRTAGFVVANHNRRQRPVLLNEFPEIARDTDPAFTVIEDAEIREAFYSLSERDRRILLLAAWEGQSSEQIAEVLEVSENAAAVALSRARARFSQALV